ncbi:hypothetical protein HK100_005823 [Physocladia obscura]|uniref:BZIP domain-containing protein n=1 Tax=Physocladia obscura TaxID=109957 RepID=A0AAD5T8A6_9FUNG|nr:hypothetical protein HK100_005823 [Physocladia obscura]
MEQTTTFEDWLLVQQSELQLQQTALNAGAITSTEGSNDTNSTGKISNKRTGSGSGSVDSHNNNDDLDLDSQLNKKERSKPGRKRANDEPADKRIAQSREAQRAFRERRANHVKELQAKVDELTKIVAAQGPSPVEIALTGKVAALETENSILRQMAFNFNFSKQPTLGLPILGATVNSTTSTLSNNSGPSLMFSPTGLSTFGGAGSNVGTLFGNISPTSTQSDLLKKQKTAETGSDDFFAELLAQSFANDNSLPTSSFSNDSPLFFQPSVSPPDMESAHSSKSTNSTDNSIDFTSFRDPNSLALDFTNKVSNDIDPFQLIQHENGTISRKEKVTQCKQKQNSFLTEGRDKMLKIPSLANNESLVDELCTSFMVNSITFNKVFNVLKTIQNFSTRCQKDSDPDAFIQTKLPEIMNAELVEMVRMKKQVLAVCNEEDGKKFYEILVEGKEKEYKEMTSKYGENASLLMGECVL